MRTVGADTRGRSMTAVTELFFDGWQPWQASVATDLELGTAWTVPDGQDSDEERANDDSVSD